MFQVEFARTMFISRINIYETYCAGAAKRIWAQDQYGHWILLWERAAVEYLKYSTIFTVNATVSYYKNSIALKYLIDFNYLY